MKLKRLLFALTLSFGLLSFGTLSQAAESTHSHENEGTDSHGEGVAHSHENEIQPMYDPCPITGSYHSMSHMNTITSNGGNTGTPHYHGVHYCQPYIEITEKLYVCTQCGHNDWRRTTATIHPGLQ